MTRRQTGAQLVNKFGDVARSAINIGARGERRAMRTFLRREQAKARSQSSTPVVVGGNGRMRVADERKIAYLKGREQAFFDVLGWIGGRISRTRRPGGIGRK